MQAWSFIAERADIRCCFPAYLRDPVVAMASPRRGDGHPDLLLELPDIAALLPQGGVDREQAAEADRAMAGLGAMADLALNHRLAQGSIGSIVGGSLP